MGLSPQFVHLNPSLTCPTTRRSRNALRGKSLLSSHQPHFSSHTGDLSYIERCETVDRENSSFLHSFQIRSGLDFIPSLHHSIDLISFLRILLLHSLGYALPPLIPSPHSLRFPLLLPFETTSPSPPLPCRYPPFLGSPLIGLFILPLLLPSLPSSQIGLSLTSSLPHVRHLHGVVSFASWVVS